MSDGMGIDNKFDALCDIAIKRVLELERAGRITHFEARAIGCCCICAMTDAGVYVGGVFYNYKVRENDNDCIFYAYRYLCIAEMFDFLRRIENDTEIQKLVDVPVRKLVADFSSMFNDRGPGELSIDEILVRWSNHIKEEAGGDPRNLWNAQAIYFFSMLSEDSNFSKSIEKDFPTRINLGIVAQKLKIENLQRFYDWEKK